VAVSTGDSVTDAPELPLASSFRKDHPITDITATTLTTTRRSAVTEDQIDHLGHMNVRFYGVNAQAGTAAVLGSLVERDEVVLRLVDVYTRHHREQLLGARLVVRSGVIDVHADGLRLYHELVNEDTDDLAATFVHRLQAQADDGQPVPLPGSVADRARAVVVNIPPHGVTRSISLDTDPVASAPGLQTLRDRDLAVRKVRSVTPEECNADGSFNRVMAPGLTWGGAPVNRRLPEMLHEGPDGERMGWASMETRMVIRRLPRLGDQIQSFSAVIALADKTSHRIQWAYDVDRGDLLTTFEVVNLAFDTGARRPMSIPPRLREAEQSVLHVDLAPRRA
jgi:acyl-CoA thioesterase FadM